MNVPRDPLGEKALKYKFIYSLAGLFLGALCVVGGVYLFYLGIDGATDVSTKILGSKSDLVDAAPGTVLFFVGLLIILITRFNIKLEKEEDHKNRGLRILALFWKKDKILIIHIP